MAHRGRETEFELATAEPLERFGYGYIHGIELDCPLEEVVLRDRLRAFLARQYPDLPPNPTDEALSRFSTPEELDTLRRNMAIHEALIRGIEVRVERPGGLGSGDEILRGWAGNLCRCTGYQNIVRAVHRASELLADQRLPA